MTLGVDDTIEEVDESATSPPANRMAVALLSLVALLVSLYLLSHSLGLGGPLVCGVGDCGVVLASKYAWVGPMPVSGIGALGSAALLLVSLMGLQSRFASSSHIALLLLAGTTLGVAFSAYLTYLEAAVIHAWCQWCVISAVIITLCFVASLPELERTRGSS